MWLRSKCSPVPKSIQLCSSIKGRLVGEQPRGQASTHRCTTHAEPGLRMSRFLLVVWCGAAMLLLNSSRAPAAEVSVDQAVAIAVENNPDLAVVANELTVARSEVQRANYVSQFNPELLSDADYRHRAGRSNSQDWQVRLAQQLEIFGQPALRRRSAEFGYERTQAEVRNHVRLLTAAVKMTFYQALLERRQSELLTELEALDRRVLRAAQAQFEAGEIGQIDLNLTRVRYGESRRARIDGFEAYRLQRSSLGRLLGGVSGVEPEPIGELVVEPLTAGLADLLARARGKRADMRAAQLEIKRLNNEAQLNQRLALPNPTVGTFFGHEQNTERFGGVSIGFSLPIFNRRQAEATAIAGRIAQSEQKLRAVQLNIEHEVSDAYSRYVAALHALKASQEDVVGPARESFGLLEEAFNARKMDLLSLSVAERQAFEARNGYLNSWFNLASARTAIDLAVGG
jgi:cobalt-zinc-cadmium efflux system outer membrane protein